MFSHPYISLETSNDLDDIALASWFKTVMEIGPSGVISSEIMKGKDQKQLSFFRKNTDGKNHYVIVLSRNLNTDEVGKIARVYDKIQPNGDFVISWSQVLERKEKIKKMSDNVLRAIALEAAKANHVSWLEEKTSEGWRYGQKHNRFEKTSPLCRDWHNLPEKYRMEEYRRMCNMLKILEKMKLSLVDN